MRYYSESKYDIFFGTKDSAGLDLPFYDPDLEYVTIQPGESCMLKTGIHPEIPVGHVGILDSRSSTSELKLDLLCRVIDCDFRGNIKAAFINNSKEPVTVYRGDYLVQMVIIKYDSQAPEKVHSFDDLTKTDRGTKEFGSTGNATHINRK